ncbi:MAG: YdcF family protein [Hyphomicrobium sp.]
MKKSLKKISTILFLLVVSGFILGFIFFSLNVINLSTSVVEKADAIVVLTGVQARLQEGAQLLQKGFGKRLLISGVNTQTRQADIRSLAGLDSKTFNCCVDLGYTALNTTGNASETQTWVKANNFHSLIIVTSNYHMPRSIAELRLALPDIRLIPHPVRSSHTDLSEWWLSPIKLRNLVAEYVKFLPSAMRLSFRYLRSNNNKLTSATQ